MKILLIHQNFPGQFLHLARHLQAQPGVILVAVARKGARGLPGIRTAFYQLHRAPERRTHHYLRSLEHAVLHGQAVLRVLQGLRRQGFVPDIVVAHPGWGEALYVKDVFPRTRVIGLFEFFYHAHGADLGFDPDHPATLDQQMRVHTRNALHLMNLENADAGVAPTGWQKSVHPDAYQHKIRVIHEGVDTEAAQPDPEAHFTLPNGKALTTRHKVVTYVARELEPYRGFPTMMRTAELLCRMQPDCEIVIVGGDEVAYGTRPTDSPNWRSKMLGEISIDPGRVHFLGKIPRSDYLRLLQVSSAHVYLTYPFVLSWSMLEAMASGCVVVGSATAPVQEVIKNGDNGMLVDFFSPDAVAKTVNTVLENPLDMRSLRARARATVLERYTIEHGILGYCGLINEVINAGPRVQD